MAELPSPVGYVGVGNMGGAVAAALARRTEVRVFDLSPAAMAAMADAGALPCASLAELARACRIIFLCLNSFDTVRRVLADDSDLVRNAAPGTLIVDQSTSHPLESLEIGRRLAARGIALIDAPISGGPRGVQAGTVLFTVGGTPEQFETVAGLLRSISQNVLHTGPAGTAMITKVANNYIASMQAAVSLQALGLALRHGCDPSTTVDALTLGSGSNHYVRNLLKPHVITGRLEMGATIEVMQKDVALALEVAAADGVDLVGDEDLTALIARCVDHYGKDASYNALALTVSDEMQVALGQTRGAGQPGPG